MDQSLPFLSQQITFPFLLPILSARHPHPFYHSMPRLCFCLTKILLIDTVLIFKVICIILKPLDPHNHQFPLTLSITRHFCIYLLHFILF